jgi:hypothetical protein
MIAAPERTSCPVSAPDTQRRSPDVFVIGASGGRSGSVNPFADTTRITLPDRRGHAATFDAFAACNRRVQSHYDDATDCAVYLLGRAVHPSITQSSALLKWCASTALSENPSGFRDLVGHFVILIDDRKSQEIHFVSDVLGARPWFVGTNNGQLIAGTDVLKISEAGLSSGQVNYNAVACWFRYNQECTGDSVLEDYRNILPAAVSVFNAAGKLLRSREWGMIDFGDTEIPRQQMLDGLHDRVKAAFDLLVRDADEINLPLSGGFDSRLLAAMASTHDKSRYHFTNIRTGRHEVVPARQVAEALGLELQTIGIARNTLDLYDDPFAFHGSGFPTGRNLTSAVARGKPDMTLVSGFMGDTLMRKSLAAKGNAYYEKDYTTSNIEEQVQSTDKRWLLLTNRVDLLRESVAKGILRRTRESMHEIIRRSRSAAKPLSHADLYGRQRLYFSNIFLQHLDSAEAALPFYSHDLINFRMHHSRNCLFDDNYPELFGRYFPQIASIPHSSKLDSGYNTGTRAKILRKPTRHLRRWSTTLLRMFNPSNPTAAAAKPSSLLTCLPSGLLAEAHHQTEIIFLAKLQVFEERLRQCNVNLNWNAM